MERDNKERCQNMHHTVLSSLKKIIQEIPVVVGLLKLQTDTQGSGEVPAFVLVPISSDRYKKATHKTWLTPFDGKQGKKYNYVNQA